jgi:hypothetical protein
MKILKSLFFWGLILAIALQSMGLLIAILDSNIVRALDKSLIVMLLALMGYRRNPT